jgi:hypothetical protein
MALPKGTSSKTAAYIDLFTSIGLSHAKASEAAKSAKSATLLEGLIERHALAGGRIDEKQAGLVAALAVQGAKIGEDERGYVVNAIIDGRLKSTDQVNGASQHPRVVLLPDTSGLHRGIQLRSSSSKHIRYQWTMFSLVMNVELVSQFAHSYDSSLNA